MDDGYGQPDADAACLRDAARVLRTRAKRVTFALRVIIRVLELRADRIDRGYDRLWIRIPPGTTINGAIVALCPDEHGVVTADVCIDGPPVP